MYSVDRLRRTEQSMIIHGPVSLTYSSTLYLSPLHTPQLVTVSCSNNLSDSVGSSGSVPVFHYSSFGSIPITRFPLAESQSISTVAPFWLPTGPFQ